MADQTCPDRVSGKCFQQHDLRESIQSGRQLGYITHTRLGTMLENVWRVGEIKELQRRNPKDQPLPRGRENFSF